MSQIEPKKATQLAKLGKVSAVPPAPGMSGASNIRQTPIGLSPQPKMADEYNAFFRWARAGRLARLFSVKSPQEVDRDILKNQTNEALIAKLSSIDLKLENLHDTPFYEHYKGELTLGRVIVGEQIRRLRMAVAGKQNRESVKPSITKGSAKDIEIKTAQDIIKAAQSSVNKDGAQ